MTKHQSDIDRAVRHNVGIAALRRIRRLVDAEAAEERLQARWALGIGAGFMAAACVFLLWLIGRIH